MTDLIQAVLKNSLARLLLGLLLLFVLSGAYAVRKSGVLSPGQLSARHPQETALQGYVSHAEFGNDCAHCHAPIHCITDDRCQSCHQDIARQRATAQGLHSLLPGTEECQSCHIEHRGADVLITQVNFANINHEKLTGFSLIHHQKDYIGEKLDCHSCHAADTYGAGGVDCLSCHSENDHDAMAARLETYGPDCLSCHDGADRMEDFEHNRVFALEGEHAEADCAGCHAEYAFAGIPQDCAGCHEEPELHAGLFGQDCARCHTALAWAPAQLTQHTFVLEHGAEDVTTCDGCHAGAYTEYPCYSCHSEAEMAAAHVGHVEAGEPLSDCIACHPTGREGEVVAAGSTSLLVRTGRQ